MSDDGGTHDHEGADGVDGAPPLPTWTPPDPPTGGAPGLPFGPSSAASPTPTWSTSPPPQPPTSGADPATAGWAPPGPPPPPPAGWGAPGPSRPTGPDGWSPPGQPLPVYAGDPSTPPTGTVVGKGRSRAALAILSVTAVLAASTFAFVALTRPDGAGSPEEAVEALFAALEAEDAIGVMEALPPGEREVLLEPMVATVGELQRLGVFDSFALEDVPGADIEVDGLALRSTNLGDGITAVRVTGGTITGTVLPDEVPVGPRTRDLIEREGGEPLEIEPASETESLADADLELVTVEEDGGWHVSLFYTIAEAARGDAPLPVFGQGVAPIGADTPEDAVRQLVQAGVDLDLERAIGYLPPDEMRVLYDYAPLFLDDARAAADETRANGFSASVDRLDLRVEGDGGTRRVTVDGMDVRATIGDGEGARITSDGTCTVLESTYRTYTTRFEPVGGVLDGGSDSVETGGPGGGSGGGSTERFDDEADLETTRMEVCEDGRMTMTVDGEEQEDTFGGGVDPLIFGRNQASFTEGLTVVEHDGRWYVSPVRSMFDSFLTSLRGLDGSEIDAFFESFDSMLGSSGSRFEELDTTIDGPGSPGTTFPGLDPTDPYVICADVYENLDPDASEAEWEAIEEAYDQCLVDQGEEPFVEPATVGEPRIVGGHVLVPSNDSITGFDLDGSEAFVGPDCSYGSWAALVAAPAADVEVARCDDELVGVDGRSGAELWRIADDRFPDRTRLGPTTLLRQDAERIVVNDLATGDELWSWSGYGHANVAADETTVYISNDTEVVALDLTTGEPRWTHPGRTTGLGVADGAVIARSDERQVQRLDPASGAVLWTSAVDEIGLRGSDVIAFGSETVIFQSARGDHPLTALDLRTGEILWSRTAPADDPFSQVVASPSGTSVVFASSGSCEVEIADQRDGRAAVPIPDLDGCAESVAVGSGHLAVVTIDDVTYEPAIVVRPVP